MEAAKAATGKSALRQPIVTHHLPCVPSCSMQVQVGHSFLPVAAHAQDHHLHHQHHHAQLQHSHQQQPTASNGEYPHPHAHQHAHPHHAHGQNEHVSDNHHAPTEENGQEIMLPPAGELAAGSVMVCILETEYILQISFLKPLLSFLFLVKASVRRTVCRLPQAAGPNNWHGTFF